jgi:hypothetical protein
MKMTVSDSSSMIFIVALTVFLYFGCLGAVCVLNGGSVGFQWDKLTLTVKCQLHWHINLKAFSSLFELMRSA